MHISLSLYIYIYIYVYTHVFVHTPYVSQLWVALCQTRGIARAIADAYRNVEIESLQLRLRMCHLNVDNIRSGRHTESLQLGLRIRHLDDELRHR